MSESPQKLIPFAKIFEIAAIHIFNDPSLLEFIPDEKSVLVSPENMRKKSQEVAIQLSLLRSKLAEIMKALEPEMDLDAKKLLEKRRDGLQEEILATLEKWKSEAQLRDLETRFAQEHHAKSVLEKILGAFADEKISLFLNSDLKLPTDIFTGAYGARFLPKESILECETGGETRSGIVYGDEKEVREWLDGEDVIAGVYDTRQKRERKCAELLGARILNPKTCNCSKKEHFIAIRAVIPGLLKAEFESVRRALAVKIPGITAPGRRPKPRPEA